MTDTVTPYAATGRLTVNPGDKVASTWGNTTFDQTMEVFASASQRDAQWPTPHDGAVCYTIDVQLPWVRRAGAWQVLYGPPPPVSTGALQTFADQSGEIWVAKPGVYAGAWRRARDVLAGLYLRNAAFSLSSTSAVIAHDALQAGDPYGLYSTSTGRLTIPAAGMWRFDHQVAAAAIVANGYLKASLRLTGSSVWETNALSGPSNNAGAIAATTILLKLATSDYIDTMASASPAVGTYGGGNTRFSFAYIGTG
jgi:hypothetical protein